MGGRANFEINVRPSHLELTKEDVRHARVIVLACVNESLPHLMVFGETLNNRRRLHEVRTGTNHV